jgi:tRNA pseudouridine65 synthase
MRVLTTVDDAVFVEKPSGQLVHNSVWAGPRERTLVHDVKDALGDGLHPVHRLDRGASGIVLFARAEGDGVARWQRALEDSRKIYLAVVRGHVGGAVDIDHAIVNEDGASKDARSRVEPIENSAVERCALVSVELFSGRHHQARRHLKHISHPILGDATHGKGALNRDFAARYALARLALHAWVLEVGGVRVVCPPPEDLAAPLGKLFSAEACACALHGPREDG